MKPLTRLRLQLTAWYAGTFTLILVVLGAIVFSVIGRRLAEELDESLTDATRAAERATQIREAESKLGSSEIADAFSELVIPDHRLFLFDSSGVPIVPHDPPAPVRAVAENAARQGTFDRHYKLDGDTPEIG